MSSVLLKSSWIRELLTKEMALEQVSETQRGNLSKDGA